MSAPVRVLSWEEGVRLAVQYVEAHASEIDRAAVVGSVLRRGQACHDVDLLVILKSGIALVETDPPLNIFVTSRECWDPALMQYAPSSGSTIGIRARAKALGYKLNQYGLFRRSDDSLMSTDARQVCLTISATLSQWVDRSLRGDLVLVRDGQVLEQPAGLCPGGTMARVLAFSRPADDPVDPEPADDWPRGVRNKLQILRNAILYAAIPIPLTEQLFILIQAIADDLGVRLVEVETKDDAV